MRLGQILVETGVVVPGHLETCLRIQEEMGQKGVATVPLVGELLVRNGFVRPDQVEQALALQDSTGRTCASCGEHIPAIVLDMADGEGCPHCGSKFETRSKPPVEVPVVASVSDRPRVEPPPIPPELRKIGKYELLREIGRGSMGVVYEALDPALNRKAALKLLHQRSGPDVQQFVKEAQLSANLPRHPQIVTVYEAGVSEGRHYIAMELIDGQPLSAWRKKGSVTIRQQTRLLRDVAVAVHHAHEHGILHCDLKPQNVMVDENRRPFVTDFGLARRSGKDAWAAQEAGMTAGTPAYMSPEQAMGLAQMDRRTDVYSLGVMLYEIFTGRIPFRASTPEELLNKTVHERVRPPSSVAKSLASTDPRGSIDAICLKALAKKPAHRYATARAFAEDLNRWLQGEPVAGLPEKRKTVPGWAAALSVAAALALCLGIGRWMLLSGELPEPAPVVKRETAAPGPAATNAKAREEDLSARQTLLRKAEEDLDLKRSELAQKARAEKLALEAERRRLSMLDDQAKTQAAAGGKYPLEWLLAGPFEHRGINTPDPPEGAIDLDAEMAGKVGAVRWTKGLAGLTPTGEGRAAVFDFAALYAANTRAVAYAMIHVKAPAAMNVLLLVGSDDGVKIWANGAVIHTHDAGRGVKIDEDKVALHLHPGWNRLLFKVTQWTQGWGLAVRIADINLRPIDGLEYDATGDLRPPLGTLRHAEER
jgi:predicted Ser/Thr protein kinase/DNA-directed RNA polymerase subunit RPC12/RpoP